MRTKLVQDVTSNCVTASFLLYSGKAYSEPRKQKRQRQQPETRENKPMNRQQDKNCAPVGLTYSVSVAAKISEGNSQ